MEHNNNCFQLEKAPCTSSISLHGEKPEEHWWSGWPGAYCVKCFVEDKDELCIGSGCDCECHREFWEEYNRAQERDDASEKMERWHDNEIEEF